MFKFRNLLIALLVNLLVLSAVASAASFETGFTSGFIKRHAISTEHFRLEMSPLIKNQTDSDGDGIADLIELVAEAAEESWEVEIEDLGYEEPLDSDNKIIIIFDDKDEYLLSGAVGITGLLSNGDPYIAINPWLSDDYLKITVAHEFFHTIQFGYDTGFATTNHGVNWAEATAVWIEEIVYDEVDDYINYLTDFFDYTDYSVFASIAPTDTLFPYALNIWPLFLQEYFNDEGVIKDIWENYFHSSADDEDLTKVYDSVLEVVEDYGENLSDVFRQFTLWNMADDEYSEAGDFPAVTALEAYEGDYYQVESAHAPALYGTNYLYFENYSNDSDFYFHIVKPEGVSFSVTLVPYDDDADIDNSVNVFIDVDEEMADELELSGLSGVDAVVAVISPITDFGADEDAFFDTGYLYNYLASFGDSIASELDVDTVLEEGEEKEGEESGMVDARSDGSLTLEVINYDEDSVSFSWNRVIEDEIFGYELYYWWMNEDEEYEMDYIEIDKPYILYKTVNGLEEGVNYEFELYAVDEDGDQVGDESNAIFVTPEEWLYTDISFMDDYYDSIAGLTDVGIFQGYSDGSFRDGDDINRAELLKILMEGRGITPDEDKYKNCFSDVADVWYSKYVCYAKEQGWIEGYADNTFKPSQTVSKVEALKILFEVYEAGLTEGQRVSELPYTDLSTRRWYSIYVWEASELGILEEEIGGAFELNNGRTRGEMAEELYRYLVVMEML